MVTYLACFIVCDFDYKEYITTRGTSVSKKQLLFNLCSYFD